MAKQMAKRPNRPEPLVVEDADILFRNFSGKTSQYNPDGKRRFSLIIPDQDIAEQMLRDGWNVKYLEPREEGDERKPFIDVKVNFEGRRPPMVKVITDGGQTILDEDTVGMLDWADIRSVDVIVNGNPYDVNGKSGISAYLRSIYVTIEEDRFEKKYRVQAESRHNDDVPFD